MCQQKQNSVTITTNFYWGFSKLKYNNSLHPEKYVVTPGDGTAYSWMDSVELEINSLVLNINIQITESDVSHEQIIIAIEDDVLMQILPELLNGELSCYEAQVKLEPFLSPQITQQRFYNPTETNEKKRIGRLFLDLENQNHPFAILCLFFPHHFNDRLSGVCTTRTKVINDEIYTAIKALDLSTFKKKEIEDLPSVAVLKELPTSLEQVSTSHLVETNNKLVESMPNVEPNTDITTTQIDKSVFIVQSSALDETIHKLNQTYPSDHPERSIHWYGMTTRKDPVLSSWNNSKVTIGADYRVSLPDGFKHTKGWEQTVYSEMEPNQCDALTSAFSSAIPGIEKILNKQLIGSHQVNIGVAWLCCVTPCSVFFHKIHADRRL